MSNITVHPDLTTRGPSPALWGAFDKANLLQPGRAVHMFEDFIQVPTIAAGAMATLYGGLKGFASTGGLASVAAVPGGALTFSSDGDDEGASIGTYHFPFIITNGTYGDLFFEARIKTSTITDTKHNIFLGLMASASLTVDIPIVSTTDALADYDMIGFHRLAGDGDYVDTVFKASGQTAATVGANAKVLVADTWVKLGFRYDSKNNTVRFYADGVELTDYVTSALVDGATFPNDVLMGPVFAVLNATGTTPGNSTIDWWRVAQIID